MDEGLWRLFIVRNLPAFVVEAIPNISCNSGKLLLLPYTKDFGRITRFLGNDLATVPFAAFCHELRSK